MQNSSQGLEKLWGNVTSSISSMQTTQTFWKRYDYWLTRYVRTLTLTKRRLLRT